MFYFQFFKGKKKVGFATYSMKTNVDYDDLFNKTRYYSLLKWNIKLCVELNDKIDYPIRNSDPLWAWSVNPEPSCTWYKNAADCGENLRTEDRNSKKNKRYETEPRRHNERSFSVQALEGGSETCRARKTYEIFPSTSHSLVSEVTKPPALFFNSTTYFAVSH